MLVTIRVHLVEFVVMVVEGYQHFQDLISKKELLIF
jgi:hypothetical protein